LVTATEKVDFQSPGHSRNGFAARRCPEPRPSLVRVIEPGRCHAFHTHPNREEIIYVLSGRAEQWVGRDHRILVPGETAFIPKGVVHGSYNPFRECLVLLAILAPSGAPPPALVDVSKDEPWVTMRKGMPVCT
jgi:oxalate decarboxylase/phosphoglucose isomerase-like protein (cupin superfamily)